MARNGFLAEDGIVLVTVEDDDQLIATAAAAFFAWKAAAVAAGRAFYIVERAGAYRPWWVQADIRVHPERWNLAKNRVKPAPAGQSGHGWGNRVDIGGDLAWAIANGPRFGWTREFGDADRNHFKHDGKTAIAGAGLGVGGAQKRKKKRMLHFYVSDPAAPRGVRYVILTDDGRRADYTSGSGTFPDGIAAQIGNAVKTDEALLEVLQKQLRDSGPTTATTQVGNVELDVSRLVEAIEALGVKIDELPSRSADEQAKRLLD